jgi:hypothetical protein
MTMFTPWDHVNIFAWGGCMGVLDVLGILPFLKRGSYHKHTTRKHNLPQHPTPFTWGGFVVILDVLGTLVKLLVLARAIRNCPPVKPSSDK